MKAAFFVTALALFAGCGADEDDLDSTEQAVTSAHMTDATTGGTADFYFLTPTAPADPTTFSGPFNATFTSRLSVDVLAYGDCVSFVPGASMYTFPAVGVYTTISAYRTSSTLAIMGLPDHRCYRVRALLDGAMLGYRDVMVESSSASPPTNVLKWKGTGNMIVSFTLRNNVDTDGDTVLNHVDACPTTPGSPTGNPATNGCVVVDNCPSDPAKTEPGICGCGHADVDADGDGNYAGNGSFSAQCSDLCDNNNVKDAPGHCGCGSADVDNDGDGNYAGNGSFSASCSDQCDSNSHKNVAGTCGCNAYLIDLDENGTGDICSSNNSCTFPP